MAENQSDDLHGNVPDSSPVALIIIDMINDLDFAEGPELFAPMLAAAKAISQLKDRAKALGIPVVYANDNFGQWRSDLKTLVSHCLNDDVLGKPIVELLVPDKDDYFVLKPKHSAFFATPLNVLLTALKARKLIFTGISGDVCVQFTAQDAYLHEYEVLVPSDCIATSSAERTEASLVFMQQILKADCRPSAEIDLEALLRTTTQDAI